MTSYFGASESRISNHSVIPTLRPLIMKLQLLSTVIVLLLPYYGLAQVVVTTVPDTTDGDAYLSAVEGEANVTIECNVTFNGSPFNTRWFIRRESVDTMLNEILFPGGIPSTPDGLAEDIRITSESNRILTILNFTSEFDMGLIQCGLESDRRTINIGFPG